MTYLFKTIHLKLLKVFIICCIQLICCEKRYDNRFEFFTEPTSVLVAADGGRAVFKCLASPENADIRWLLNGTPLYESTLDGIRISRHKLVIRLPKTINGATNYSLVSSDSYLDSKSHPLSHSSSSLPSPQSQSIGTSPLFNGGVFQCIAYHKNRAIVSQPAKLILAELKPFASADNVSVEAIEGNTAVIPCNPPYSVPNVVTEFYFNATIIHKTKERYRLMPSGDLQIFNAKESDSGIYRCIAHNPFLGQRIYAQHYVQLTVNKQSRHHHSIHAHNHYNQHKSHRNTHSTPKFSVTPKAHTSAIMGSNVTFECAAMGSPNPNITWKKLDGHLPKWRHIQDGGNLILPSVRRGDEGTYICSASIASNIISANSVLDIQEIPQIVRPPEDKQALEDEEIALECATKGKPKPIVSWLLNGELIKLENSNKTGILIRGSDGSKLMIAKANSSLHSGIYQCFATNELGSTYATSVVNIMNSSLTIVNHNSKDITLTDDDESDLVANTADGDLIDEDDDLFERAPNQNRRRKNKNKGIKMVPPTRPEITRLSDDSVMVRWDVPQNDGLPILFFKVQFREMGNKGSEWNTVDEDIPPHIHSYAVNGLREGSKYRFRIAAVYSNNDNKLGPNSIKFTLYKDPPMKKPVYGPAIIHAEPVSPSAITLKWEYLDIDSVAIDGFFIYYRATHTAGDYIKVASMGANTRSHIITHLLPDTSYDIKMQCFNVAGPSEFSNIYIIKTLPSADIKDKGKKDQNENNDINGSIGTVRSDDDKTLINVLLITIGAVVSVIIVCIVLCIVRHKQQTPPNNMSSGKLPKEKHPKAGANNHSHLFSHSNHNLFAHHRSNGHISNTLAAAASNGYLSRNNTLDSECNHQINIRVNPFCEISNGPSLSRRNSMSETLKSMSASHHQLSQHNNVVETQLSLNTMERRKMKRMDEHYPNLHQSNPRLNHHNSSFTRLNGTLERKRRSRTDLLSNDIRDNDIAIGKCSANGSSSATNGKLVIMQSSC